jgi:hypothetical protein
MTTRFMDDLAKRFLAMSVQFDEPLIGLAFFDRVEISTLDILDQRNFKRDPVVKFANDCRDLVELCALGRPPTGRTTIG